MYKFIIFKNQDLKGSSVLEISFSPFHDMVFKVIVMRMIGRQY